MPLRLEIDWEALLTLPLCKLMQARTKLFRQRPAVREALYAEQPEHIRQTWETDLAEDLSFVGPLRLDCLVTPAREVFCNEIDLLPGGPGIVIALERYFFDGDAPTLDAYCHYLERAGVECLALVALSTEADLMYLPERSYMAECCRARGLPVWAVEARQLTWHRDGPYLPNGRKITHVDRFYSGWQLRPDDPLWRLAAFGVSEMLPLRKEYLEAKLWDALLWDPRYASFWYAELGSDFERFKRLIPETYLLRDHAPRFSELLGTSPAARQQRSQWMLKEGAPAVSSNWGSRSVHQLSTLSVATLTALFQQPKNPAEEAPTLNGWTPTSPILQRFVSSARYHVPLDGGGTHSGFLRCSPFFWIHPGGTAVSKGLATVRPHPIVYDVSDAVMTING